VSAMIGNPLLLADEGYQISRSVRLRSSASAYFNRTPASAGNRKTWTWSGWWKLGPTAPANGGTLFSADNGSGNYTVLLHATGGAIEMHNSVSGVGGSNFISSAVFRDPSSWYHVVMAVDTTQATLANRAKLYINGVLQTWGTNGGTAWDQNRDTWVDGTNSHYLGQEPLFGSSARLDGYLTEINFIDGQALTPSSFGETDAITGVWKPKKYTGSYGTNGFYLNFSDPSAATAAAIGKDYSGNGNNWTPNNISVTAGSTYDSMLDVPTLWADGGNGRGNYCILNALSRMGTPTNSAANLQTNLATSSLINGSQVVSSGKWYYEAQFTSGSDAFIGWNRVDLQTGTGNAFQQAGSLLYLSSNGNRYKDGDGGASYGASYSTSDAIGCAIDLDANQVTWYKNNVSQGTISIVAGNYAPSLATGGTACNFLTNFGQRPFTYTPPTGFRALNTQNLPEPLIKKGNQWFDATLYQSVGASQTVVNSGPMQPDLVWVKDRTGANNNYWVDAVRGTGKALFSNLTNAESTDTNTISAFNSNGFSINGTSPNLNTSNNNYVAWQWKEGATPGFDIVTYNGSGGSQNVAHSLGVAPRMMIVKSRSTAGTAWPVYHASLGNTQVVTLNTTSATATVGVWGNTTPTSSVFTVSDAGATNGDTNFSGRTYVAYLFAEVAGFSKFGSYTGNGSSDGPFVFCGFRPRWVLYKRTDRAGDSWMLFDTARGVTNLNNAQLYPNISNAETTGSGIDIVSNGFKLRDSDGSHNGSGGTYIFAAFAEFPFRTALAR
jgi:hypothetical protein